MGTTNYGDQTLNFDYRNPGTSQSFNQINYQLHLGGVYDGGLLTKIDNSTVEVAPLTCYIEDPNLELGVRVSTANAQQKSVNTSNIFIVLRMTWINTENNYMDMLTIPNGSIQTGDLILGRCVFDGGTLTGFDYSRRNDATIVTSENNESKFKINPQEPPTSTIAVNAGDATIDGVYVEFAGDTIVLTDTTLGRIDLLYIDSSGTLGKIEGVDSGSPVEPDWNSNVLILGRITRGATATFVTGDQIVNFISDRPFYKIPSITSVTSGYTALSTDNLILANGTFTIDLPASASSKNLELILKNIGSGLITIDANSTELIDLSETYILYENNSIKIRNDGTKWRIINAYISPDPIQNVLVDTILNDSNSEQIIESDTSNLGLTLTLPDPANNVKSKIFIKQVANGGRTIVSGTIDGEINKYLDAKDSYLNIYSNGTEYKKIDYDNYITTGWINNSDWTNRKFGLVDIDYDNLTGTYDIGETVREYSDVGRTAPTGVYGIIFRDTGSTLTITNAEGGGVFTNNLYLKGDNSGATSDVNEGSGSTKNLDNDYYHGFKKNISDIRFELYVSVDGTWSNAIRINGHHYNDGAITNAGLSIFQNDVNSISFKIGASGLKYQTLASGIGVILVSQDQYFNIFAYINK